MHSPRAPYLILALLPFALANIVSQISDGQIQEPAEAPTVAAPKIAIAATSAPPPAPAVPTLTSTSLFTATQMPSPSTSPESKEAGAFVAPPLAANTSIIPAPAKIEEAATTAPILIAPPPAAANFTVPSHHADYKAPHPSASVGKVMPAENGTAPTVPVVPTLPAVASQVATSTEGSPREAGTSQAVSRGGAPKQAIGVGLMAVGMGLVAMVVG